MCRYVGDVTHVCGRRRGRREGVVGRGGAGGGPTGACRPTRSAHAPHSRDTAAPRRPQNRHSARAPQPRHTSALRSAASTADPTTPDRRCRAEPSVCVQCLTVGNFWCLRSRTERFCEIERSAMLGLRSGGKTI